MKATRILLAVCAGVALAAVGGCSTTYDMTIRNATSQDLNVEIVDDIGIPVKEVAIAKDGGMATCSITQKDSESLSYKMIAGRASKGFVLNKETPNPMNFFITDNGITGPLSKSARFKEETKSEKTVPIIINKPKLTGDN